eukprot:770235-Pleurochrysis_carterae.AAC.4
MEIVREIKLLLKKWAGMLSTRAAEVMNARLLQWASSETPRLALLAGSTSDFAANLDMPVVPCEATVAEVVCIRSVLQIQPVHAPRRKYICAMSMTSMAVGVHIVVDAVWSWLV